MIDIEKDIEVEIYINVSGKRRAKANVIIGGLIKVNDFEIVQAENGNVYVINPHIISNVYNKTSCKREITYLSTASLLEHKDRKALVDKILDRYAEEIEKMKVQRTGGENMRDIQTGSRHITEINSNIKRDYSI